MQQIDNQTNNQQTDSPLDLNNEIASDAKYAKQKEANIDSVFDPDAISYYIDHPADFIEDVFRAPPYYDKPLKLENWQRDVCEEVVNSRFVAIAAGSGVGKSFLISKLIYWFLTTRKGKVPCTAPTVHQLFDILWSELRKDYDVTPELKQLFTWTQTKLFMNGHNATWFAVARTATVKKDGKVQEGLQGFHDANLMYLIDEASGVEDSAMVAVDGALTAENAICIMTGNPTRLSGRFWSAFHKSAKKFGGPWATFNVDCRDSEHVGKNYISMMAKEYGEESFEFKSKVAGQFPDTEEAGLISQSDFDAAVNGVYKASTGIKTTLPVKSTQDINYRSRQFATQAQEQAAKAFYKRSGFYIP